MPDAMWGSGGSRRGRGGVIGVWQRLGEESLKSQARESGTGRHGRIIFEKQQGPGAWSKQTLEPAGQV